MSRFTEIVACCFKRVSLGVSDQLSCISLPRHEEDYLQNVVGSAAYILILGQDCSARYQLLNCLLGERLLPLGSEVGGACGPEGGACRRRKLCFTHGRQTRLSLALPGQYELVHQLAAHCGRWDTVSARGPGDPGVPGSRAAIGRAGDHAPSRAAAGRARRLGKN